MIDEASHAISDRLVELAGIERGSRVLDIAAGYGEPTLAAARKAGPDGLVIASDIAGEMIAFGRERAAAAGVTTIQFIEREAAALQFPDHSFDAAVSRWGIIFEPEAEAAARRVRRFLKHGGRFAISSWGPPERVPLLAIPMRAAAARLQLPPPPPGAPGPLSRSTPDALRALLDAGGFSDVHVEEAEVTYEFESAAEFAEFTMDVGAPLKALLAPRPAHVQEDVWSAVAQAAEEAAAGGGSVTFTNLALLASGRA